MTKEEIIKKAISFQIGGMQQPELEFLHDACLGKRVLELGSEVGQSSYVIASVCASITCIDIWDSSYSHLNHDEYQKNIYLSGLAQKGDIFKKFLTNCDDFLKAGKMKYIQANTSEACSKIIEGSFDIIVVDADHSYQGVSTDINNYLPKLSTNGLMMFHDFSLSHWPGVVRACAEMIERKKLRPICNIKTPLVCQKI